MKLLLQFQCLVSSVRLTTSFPLCVRRVSSLWANIQVSKKRCERRKWRKRIVRIMEGGENETGKKVKWNRIHRRKMVILLPSSSLSFPPASIWILSLSRTFHLLKFLLSKSLILARMKYSSKKKNVGFLGSESKLLLSPGEKGKWKEGRKEWKESSEREWENGKENRLHV